MYNVWDSFKRTLEFFAFIAIVVFAGWLMLHAVLYTSTLFGIWVACALGMTLFFLMIWFLVYVMEYSNEI